MKFHSFPTVVLDGVEECLQVPVAGELVSGAHGEMVYYTESRKKVTSYIQ
jgi:hypothetical protein